MATDEKPIASSRGHLPTHLGFSKLEPIKQIIFQPTPFCNLNCSYCYLSESSRSSSERMSVNTAVRTISTFVDSGQLANSIDIRWHAGEPLVASHNFYSETISEIKKIVPNNIKITHSMQTNGTLISNQWCDLFLKENIRIGVSIDGPAFLHDRYRVSKGGEGTFNEVIRGIRRLHKRGVPFEIIAVITKESLEFPNELYDFFSGLNPEIVAFNIEESEGEYNSKLLQEDDFIKKYRAFFLQIYNRQKGGPIKFREIEEIKKVILYGKRDRKNLQVEPFSIVTIDWAGNVYTFSPELAGMKHLQYPSFSLGNILENSLNDILNSKVLKSMASDIFSGVEQCRKSCEYFPLCGGGAPANKLYENGTFRSTETGYCKARFQVPTDIILSDLESQY